MPSHRTVLVVALLAALAGAATSLYFEPTIAYRLASTDIGQRLLSAALEAKAPMPPAGTRIAERDGKVPTMTLHDLDGTAIEVPATWAGRTTLINLWATWCAPCLKEMPELQAFADAEGSDGVRVVGIALDDAGATRALLARLHIRYPVLVDTPGPADAGVRLGNRAGVLPYSILIDREGRVRKTRVGPFTDQAEITRWTEF